MKRWRAVQVRTAVPEEIACHPSSGADSTAADATQSVDLVLRKKPEGARRENRK